LLPGRLRLGGEQNREQQQRAELADRAGQHGELAEIGLDRAGVAQYRHHHSQRAGGHGQGQQPQIGAVCDLAQGQRDRDRHDQAKREAGEGQPEHRAAELPDLDLLAGQEEQEAEAEQVQNVDAASRMDQVEGLRPDGDAGQHLQHHWRHQPAGDEPCDQRRRECCQRDREQPSELNGHRSPRRFLPGSSRPHAGITAAGTASAGYA
jgi:hypothetical protein